MATIARTFIEKGSIPEAVAANLAYTEFWGKHHMEHADVLTLFLRPQDVQLIQGAAQFRTRFDELLREATNVDLSQVAGLISRLNQDTLLLTRDWRTFLEQALNAQRTCAVQENFTQRLTEHIMIETDLLTEAVLRAQARQAGTALSAVPPAGATFDQLPSKAVLVS